MNNFHKPFCTSLVVKLLKQRGFSTITPSTLNILCDTYVKFIQDTALNSASFAELCGRDKTSLEDVMASLESNNMKPKEVLNYSLSANTFPHNYPKFPAPAKCKLNFPDACHESAHIPDNLPSQNFHFTDNSQIADDSFAEIDPSNGSFKQEKTNEDPQEGNLEMDYEPDIGHHGELSPAKSATPEQVVASDHETGSDDPCWVKEQTREIENNKIRNSQGIGASVSDKLLKTEMFSPSSDYNNDDYTVKTQIENARILLNEGYDGDDVEQDEIDLSPKGYVDDQPDSPMIFDDDFNDHKDVYNKSPIKNSSKIEEAASTFSKNSQYWSSDDNSNQQSDYIGTTKSATKTAKHKSSERMESFDDIKVNLPVVKHKKVKKKKKEKKEERKRKMSDHFDFPPIKIPKVKIKENISKSVVQKIDIKSTSSAEEKSLKKKVKKDRKNREKEKREKSKSKSLAGSSEVFPSPQIKIKFTNIAPTPKKAPAPKPVHHQVVAPPTKKETKAAKQKQSSKHKVKSSAKQSKHVESHAKTEKEPSASYNYQNKSRVTTQTVIEKSNQQEGFIEYDEEGNKIWYCPACGGPDDGSQMIGCDNEEMCDNWYHYPCVNITETPADDEKWYCPDCTKSKKSKKKKKKH